MRATKHAAKAYLEIQDAGGLAVNTTLLFPLLMENADDFPANLDQEVRNSLEGVLLFEGRAELSLASKFDSLRNLRLTMGDDFVIGLHDNATPCK